MSPVFIDNDLPGRLHDGLADYFNDHTPDRMVRVIRGQGRQQDPNTLREAPWFSQLRDFTLVGELDQDPRELIDDAVTISTYDCLSNMRRTYDETGIRWHDFYLDGQSPGPVPIYDCIRLDPPEGSTGEPMVENPDAARITHWCEVAPGVITFLIPLTGIGNATRFLWDRVLSEPLAAATDPDWATQREARQEAANLERFREVAALRDDGELRGIRTRINDHTEQVASAQRMLEENRQSLREQQELLDAVLARRDEGGLSPEAVEREYAAILRHAHVTGVSWVGPQTLNVRTNDITLTHPNTGDTTVVGRYSIDFNFEQSSVRINNLTNRRGTWDHPHVSNGDFCSGELQPTVMRLLSRRQIGAAVNMVIAALEYCDPEDDWGRHVEWWFGAPDAPDPSGEEL